MRLERLHRVSVRDSFIQVYSADQKTAVGKDIARPLQLKSQEGVTTELKKAGADTTEKDLFLCVPKSSLRT